MPTRNRVFFVVRVVLLAGLAVLWGCTVPLGERTDGVVLTFQVATPTGAKLSESGSEQRLLLSNAARVTVTATSIIDKSKATAAAAILAGQSAVSVTVKLKFGQTYDIEATAVDAAGTALYTGTIRSYLVSGTVSKPLSLIPARSANLVAADQPAGGVMTEPNLLPGGLLAAGTSASYRIDFGTTATAFTFPAQPAGLAYYLQDSNGALLAQTSTVTSASAGKFFWVTFFDPSASHTLTTIGTFTIPIQSISLSVPAASASTVGQTFSVTASWLPANATDTGLTWQSGTTAVATVDGSGTLTTGSQAGSTSITATNTATGISQSVDFALAALAFGLPGNGVDLGVVGPATIAHGTSVPVTTTNTALQTGGSNWELQVDGATVSGVSGYATLTVPVVSLPVGSHTISMFVTLNSIDYSGDFTLVVTQ